MECFGFFSEKSESHRIFLSLWTRQTFQSKTHSNERERERERHERAKRYESQQQQSSWIVCIVVVVVAAFLQEQLSADSIRFVLFHFRFFVSFSRSFHRFRSSSLTVSVCRLRRASCSPFFFVVSVAIAIVVVVVFSLSLFIIFSCCWSSHFIICLLLHRTFRLLSFVGVHLRMHTATPCISVFSRFQSKATINWFGNILQALAETKFQRFLVDEWKQKCFNANREQQHLKTDRERKRKITRPMKRRT